MNASNQAKAYQSMATYSGVAYADPHSLITQMLDGALNRLSRAKGAMLRQDVAEKGLMIGNSISIIAGLHACLDHEQGGELSKNLSDLYEYMNLRLAQANVENNVTKIDEVGRLLGEIRAAWVQIPVDLRPAQKQA